MRELTEHKQTGVNQAIDVNVMDEPGEFGANYSYELVLNGGTLRTALDFNTGKSKAAYNGFSHQSILIILIDRLRCFQAGPMAKPDRAEALRHLEEALMWLQKDGRIKESMEMAQRGSIPPQGQRMQAPTLAPGVRKQGKNPQVPTEPVQL